MTRALVILTLIMLSMFACVAVVYREDIADAQAYTTKKLLPNIKGCGEDRAP